MLMPLVLLVERGVRPRPRKPRELGNGKLEASHQDLLGNSVLGSGLAALLATSVLVCGSPWIVGGWIGLLWAVPIAAWLTFYTAVVAQPAGAAVQFEEDIVSLSTRVVGVLGVVFLGQWAVVGLSEFSLNVIWLGSSRAAFWYFAARTVGVPPHQPLSSFTDH